MALCISVHLILTILPTLRAGMSPRSIQFRTVRLVTLYRAATSFGVRNRSSGLFESTPIELADFSPVRMDLSVLTWHYAHATYPNPEIWSGKFGGYLVTKAKRAAAKNTATRCK